jgi:hypothetical protein
MLFFLLRSPFGRQKFKPFSLRNRISSYFKGLRHSIYTRQAFTIIMGHNFKFSRMRGQRSFSFVRWIKHETDLAQIKRS